MMYIQDGMANHTYSLFSPYTLNEWIHVYGNSCEILHLTVITCIESIAHNLVYLLAGIGN